MQNCLIIDEEPQVAFIEEIQNLVKENGLEVNFIYFNPATTEWLTFSNNNDIPPSVNEELLYNNLDLYLKQRIDVILSDYDFKLSNKDGFGLLEWIRTKRKSTKLILYSSKGDFQNTFIKDTFLRSPDEIRRIIKSNINDIINREHRLGELLKILKNERFDTDLLIEEELSKYPNLKINNSNPEFENLTIKEILEFINDTNSNKGFKFKKNLIELTIAHLIQLEA